MMLRRRLQGDNGLSKRDLGWVAIAGGLALVGGMLLMELVGGTVPGLGVIQWIGIIGGAGSVLVGLTLLPLGDQPA